MNVLLVAVDAAVRLTISRQLRLALPHVDLVEADGPAELETVACNGAPGLVIVAADGFEQPPTSLLHRIKRLAPVSPVILVGSDSGAETAVSALKSGFDDYLVASDAGLRRLGTAAHEALARGSRDGGQGNPGLFERLPASLCTCATDGRLLDANASFRRMLAIEGHIDPGTEVLTAYFDDPTLFDRLSKGAEELAGAEVLLRRRGGEACWTVMSVRRIGDRLACAFTDITGRKQADDRTGDLLREKNVLLEELYHRVNNNLQIVMSFVHQFVRETDHPGARANLQDLSARIQSLALVQDQLYRNQNFAEAELGQYLEELCAARLRGSSIVLETDVVDLQLPIGLAIPISLIANELLVNAVQHAFPGVTDPRITVRLQRVSADRAVLLVEDNGIGLGGRPPPPGHGYRLIGILSRQAGAEMSLEASAGTRVEISFPVPR